MSSDGAGLRFPEKRLSQFDLGHTRSNFIARWGNWQPPRKRSRLTLRAGRCSAKMLVCATASGWRPPRCSSPLSLINSQSPGSRPYNPALRERGVKGRVAAAKPPFDPALLILKSPNFCFHRASRPATCLNYYLFLLLVRYSRIVVESSREYSRIVEGPAWGVFPNSRGKLPGFTQTCGNRRFTRSGRFEDLGCFTN